MENKEYVIHAPFQIGLAIDEQRKHIGMSQREFCGRVNLSYGNYRRIKAPDSNLIFSRIFEFFAPLILTINGCWREAQLLALFRRRMRELQINQTTLAKYSCVSQSLVSRVFGRRRRGEKRPSLHASSGIALAVALDIELRVYIRSLAMLETAMRDRAFAALVDGITARHARICDFSGSSRALGRPPNAARGAIHS